MLAASAAGGTAAALPTTLLRASRPDACNTCLRAHSSSREARATQLARPLGLARSAFPWLRVKDDCKDIIEAQLHGF